MGKGILNLTLHHSTCDFPSECLKKHPIPRASEKDIQSLLDPMCGMGLVVMLCWETPHVCWVPNIGNGYCICFLAFRAVYL